jgi:hypothetical protein
MIAEVVFSVMEFFYSLKALCLQFPHRKLGFHDLPMAWFTLLKNSPIPLQSPMKLSSIFRLSATGSIALSTVMLGATGANAQLTCGAAGTTDFSEVSAANFACKRGDKTYSDFSFSGADWAASGTTFSYSSGGPGGINHTISASGTYLTGVYNYSYKMTIDPVMSPGYYFLNYSSQFGGSNTSTKSGTKTLQSPTYALATTGVVAAVNAPASGVTNVVVTSPNAGPLVYNGSINVTEGYFDTWSDSVTQAVPGPLPLLGAGAAFGFSRKLRSRIKNVSA